MSEFVATDPFPAGLDQFKEFVGLPFYADETFEQVARTDPTRVDQADFALRHGLYILVQRAITGIPETEQLTGEQVTRAWEDADTIEALRKVHRNLLRHVRGELMEADPGLKSPVVLRFERALDNMPAVASRQRGITDRSKLAKAADVGVLPAYLTTLRSIGRIVATTRKDALAALRQRRICLPSMHLPSSFGGTEYLLPWAAVRRLGEWHGYRDYLNVDFDRLPTSLDDTDADREAYARWLQYQVIPHHKLINIPGLITDEEFIEMRQPARSYELTLYQMSRLLQGGYHYLEDYMCTYDIRSVSRLNPVNNTPNEYVTKEEAAGGWAAYWDIPQATLAFTALSRVAENVGVHPQFLRSSLHPNEREAVRILRAIRPAGRVLEHLPDEFVPAIRERLIAKALPAFRITAHDLTRYLPVSYSQIMKRIKDMEVFVPKQYVVGSNKLHKCCDWYVVYCLEMIVGRKPGDFRIDYGRLPQTADDTDPERIAYAREVQTWFGLDALFSDAGLVPSDTEQYPLLSELDSPVQEEVRSLAWTTRFSETAVIRLLLERDIALEPGCSKNGLLVLNSLRVPTGSTNLDALVRSLDMQPCAALDFLHKFRGEYSVKLNSDGYPEIVVGQLSAEMLKRQRYPAGDNDRHGSVPLAADDWVTIEQILRAVNVPLHDLIGWVERRMTKGTVMWLRAKSSGLVLPHLPLGFVTPFVLAHKKERSLSRVGGDDQK